MGSSSVDMRLVESVDVEPVAMEGQLYMLIAKNKIRKIEESKKNAYNSNNSCWYFGMRMYIIDTHTNLVISFKRFLQVFFEIFNMALNILL